MKHTERVAKLLNRSGWFVISAVVFALASTAMSARAQVVYVTARPQPSGSGPNTNGGYSEINITLGDASAKGGAPGRPAVAGARAYLAGTNLTDSTAGFDLSLTLPMPCEVYQIAHNFNSSAGNISADVVLSASCSGGTLSFTNTEKFQSSYGDPTNVWQTLGYLTNATTTPTLRFRYLSGMVNAVTMNRLIVDCFRFASYPTCLLTPMPSVNGPLVEGQTQVEVAGVVSNALAVSVYQDAGAGMGIIGQRTSGLVAGVNLVPVTPLIRGARVGATQTLYYCGGESCLPVPGLIVGPSQPGPISISLNASNLMLNWTGSYHLQSSSSVTGPWENVGNVTNAPYGTNINSSAEFFRLRIKLYRER